MNAWPRRRGVAALVAITIVCSACSGSSGSTSHSSGATLPTVQAESTQQTVTALAGVGVATLADETATHPEVAVTGATVFAVTAVQAANMTREADASGGITGTDLDAAVPMHGAPPMAYVIGGWVLEAHDAASAAAARLLGPVDWTHAVNVVFPTEVLALFVGDIVQHMTASTSAARSAPGESAVTDAHLDVARQDAAPNLTAPCSTIANFFNTILNTVFNALKLDPGAVADWVSGKLGGGTLGAIAGAFVGFFASAWNRAVDLARSAAEAVLTKLTQPVLDILRLAIGAVATLTTVVSYLKPWKAPITADPAANQFGITGGAARTGSVTVAIDKQAEIAQWPPQLVDCAKTFKITLPTLSKSGLPVTWDVFEPEALVTVDQPSGPPFVGTLNDDLKSTLQYTTLRESAKLAATGAPVAPEITAIARVGRTEVDDLRKIVTNLITGEVPDLLKPVVDPIVASYIEWATRFLDTLVNVEGSTKVAIIHHIPRPPEPTTTSSSTTSTPSSAPPVTAGNAKCTDLTDAAASAAVGRATRVTLDTGPSLPGLTICQIVVAGEIDPIQLDVDTTGAAAKYRVDREVGGESDIAGIGDQAFRSATGIEALVGNVSVDVIGPAEPILLHHDFSQPTALVRAMVAPVK